MINFILKEAYDFKITFPLWLLLTAHFYTSTVTVHPISLITAISYIFTKINKVVGFEVFTAVVMKSIILRRNVPEDDTLHKHSCLKLLYWIQSMVPVYYKELRFRSWFYFRRQVNKIRKKSDSVRSVVRASLEPWTPSLTLKAAGVHSLRLWDQQNRVSLAPCSPEDGINPISKT
jgi:hypothetical protein